MPTALHYTLDEGGGLMLCYPMEVPRQSLAVKGVVILALSNLKELTIQLPIGFHFLGQWHSEKAAHHRPHEQQSSIIGLMYVIEKCKWWEE